MDTEPAHRGLRTTFDEVAEAYDRARPRYPEAVLDDLVELARLDPGARVVEIGCGTGQATVPLAERGLRVTCVELGASLAAVGRRRLAAFPHVEVVTADFEAWRPARADYDAVVAFTAFHWLDPERRWARCAAVLGDGGHVAVVATQHVLPPGGDEFFRAVQEDYAAVLGGPVLEGPPAPDAVPDVRAEMEASGCFDPVGIRRHVWDVEYDAEAYLAVLDTYSSHRAMADDARAALYDRIRRRILTRPAGRIRKSYLATLVVGVRR